MRPMGKTMAHVHLVKAMAQCTDTDLVEAYAAGDLDQNAWADIVQTCRACDWAEPCMDWVQHNDHQDSAPRTCANRARFGALRCMALARQG